MEKYRKAIYRCAGAAFAFAIIFLFLKYALPVIIPFLISLLIAVISRPLVNRICKNTNLNKSAVSVIVMFLLLFIISYIIFIASSAAITQIGNILNNVSNNLSSDENYITRLFKLVESLKLKFPFLNNTIFGSDDTVYTLAMDMVSEGIKNTSMKITSQLASLVASLPSIIITAVDCRSGCAGKL